MAEAFITAFLALCFFLSACYKIRDADEFRGALEDFSLLRRLPSPVQALATYLVPIAEIGVAVLLVAPGTTRLGAFAACGLAGAFALVVGLDSRSTIAHCGCWGVASAEIPKTYYLARSGLLLLAAAAALVLSVVGSGPSWDFDLAVAAFGLTAPLALLVLELPQIGQIIYVQSLATRGAAA